MKRLLFILLALCAATAVSAQTPAADLVPAPANAERFDIISGGAPRGVLLRWTTPDGVHWSRENYTMRSLVSDVDLQQRFAADGSLQSFIARGGSTFAAGDESFSVADGRYRYQSPADHGEGVYPSGAYYFAVGGTFDATIRFTDALLAAPNHALRLLPSGEARLIEIATRQVSNGQESKTLTGYAIVGAGLAPTPVWYDGDRFFAFVDGYLSYVPSGWEAVLDDLSAAQDAAAAARNAALVDQLGPRPTQPVLFQDVRIFDSIGRRFREHQSVLVEQGRITAVGAARTVRAPADAQIIPGAGRTLIPGLWDSHLHYGGDETGPLLLSQGITSVRDPGNNPEDSTERRHRIENGQLLGPRIVPSLMINGGAGRPGGYAVIAHTLDEALADVRRAHNEGYFAAKIYSEINPAWVAPMAAEAHRLGLHVHGHVPHGMRPLEAVHAGYDEITHIIFVMMQAMPQTVVDESSSVARYYGIAQYGPGVDLRGPAMRPLLDELVRRHITIDPTLVAWETAYVPEPGESAPAYAPFAGTMPPQVDRSFAGGGLPPTPQVSRAQMRQGEAALQALVGELYRRHITIVAGTDGSGLELVRELELYVAAGMSNADALASATIVPSQLFGVGAVAGSITPGKNAELALVDGDPSRAIGDLRRVVMVMRDGRLMQADDLRRAIGITGMPPSAH